MDTLKDAISLCATIYEMYGKFTSNKGQCDWLLKLVKSIMSSLEQQLTRSAVPENLQEPLLQLQEDLRGCKTVLEEFGLCGRFKRFVLGSKHAQQFNEAGHRLSTSYNTFCLAINSHLALDQRDQQFESILKLDLIMFALHQAVQLDFEDYKRDLETAMQDPDLSEQLSDIGISSSTSTYMGVSSFGLSSGGRAIITFEDAQGCSWCDG